MNISGDQRTSSDIRGLVQYIIEIDDACYLLLDLTALGIANHPEDSSAPLPKAQRAVISQNCHPAGIRGEEAPRHSTSGKRHNAEQVNGSRDGTMIDCSST